ncbi:MAG: flagellar biosynthetic protein FliR, partial [Oceanisphaera sp.]|uniref:flagellar biosynthetic protein FliR n=1 Tax=Oceanisphaera sp. TaxID=1929979 RepID=UPI003C78DBFD
MTYSTDQIVLWIASSIWPLCRIAGMMMTRVMFGANLTPMYNRLLLAVATTIAVAPVLPTMPDVA